MSKSTGESKSLLNDLPKEISQSVLATIERINGHHNVDGIMYFRDHEVLMCTVPRYLSVSLSLYLPVLTTRIHHSVHEISAAINNINPIIDRIMEDDSVVSVVMTNRDGNPILTNVNLIAATNFGKGLHQIAQMVQRCVTELDVFNEALTLRLNTKNYEILLVPHKEFNIIVVQQQRDRGGAGDMKRATK